MQLSCGSSFAGVFFCLPGRKVHRSVPCRDRVSADRKYIMGGRESLGLRDFCDLRTIVAAILLLCRFWTRYCFLEGCGHELTLPCFSQKYSIYVGLTCMLVQARPARSALSCKKAGPAEFPVTPPSCFLLFTSCFIRFRIY